MTEYFTSPQGRRLAYDRTQGQGPGVVFLCGFRSNMQGTKAVFLADGAKAQGRAFLRFDYSGHGESGGDFLDGSISDWAEDAVAALCALTTGPQVLVGSSMGGWISLLVAKAMPGRIKGFVGIAAAPDFVAPWTDNLTPAQRAELTSKGHFTEPSAYDPLGYPVGARLLGEGTKNDVLTDPLDLPFPVRLLHGTADVDVLPSVGLRILNHATSPDLRLTLVKGADHRFSTPACLALMVQAIGEVSG